MLYQKQKQKKQFNENGVWNLRFDVVWNVFVPMHEQGPISSSGSDLWHGKQIGVDQQ